MIDRYTHKIDSLRNLYNGPLTQSELNRKQPFANLGEAYLSIKNIKSADHKRDYFEVRSDPNTEFEFDHTLDGIQHIANQTLESFHSANDKVIVLNYFKYMLHTYYLRSVGKEYSSMEDSGYFHATKWFVSDQNYNFSLFLSKRNFNSDIEITPNGHGFIGVIKVTGSGQVYDNQTDHDVIQIEHKYNFFSEFPGVYSKEFVEAELEKKKDEVVEKTKNLHRDINEKLACFERFNNEISNTASLISRGYLDAKLNYN